MWHEKALFAQAPATHPEPAREGPTEDLSPKQHKTRSWKLKFCKGNCARGTNLTPNVSLLKKAALGNLS